MYRNLDGIFAGDCEGLTYEEIERTHGDEARLRKRDKLGYRYPRGESYLDLIARLDPLMHELESYKEPLLVVSHQATLRVLYSYLVGGERRDARGVWAPDRRGLRQCAGMSVTFRVRVTEPHVAEPSRRRPPPPL